MDFCVYANGSMHVSVADLGAEHVTVYANAGVLCVCVFAFIYRAHDDISLA